jgi:hypothetical protein
MGTGGAVDLTLNPAIPLCVPTCNNSATLARCH